MDIWDMDDKKRSRQTEVRRSIVENINAHSHVAIAFSYPSWASTIRRNSKLRRYAFLAEAATRR
jgi:hypothetical protein